MYRARLERTSERSPVRTPFVDGLAKFPVIEKPFYLLAKGLTAGFSYRHITTSPTVEMFEEQWGEYRKYSIITQSGSLYVITFLLEPVHEYDIDKLLEGGATIFD